MCGLERRGGEDFKGREKVMVRHGERGNGESRGAAGPSEYEGQTGSRPCVWEEKGIVLSQRWQKSWLVQVSATSLAGC